MKRLLAYLFIVLGLGLVFISKSFSLSFSDIETVKIGLLQNKSDTYTYIFAPSAYKIYKIPKIGYYAGRAKIKKNGNIKGKIFFFPHKGYSVPSEKNTKSSYYDCTFKTKVKNITSGSIRVSCVNAWYDGKYYKDESKFKRASVNLTDTNSGFELHFIKNLDFKFFSTYDDLEQERNNFFTRQTQTQIAKAEPSQTQKVVKKNDFEKALDSVANKDWYRAEKLFRKFIDENPKDKKAGEAQFWYAETFMIRELYTDAALAYLEGYKKYPKSEKGPQNLLKLGVSLVQIEEKDQGCLMITGVQKQYPNSRSYIIERAKAEEKKYRCTGFDSNVKEAKLHPDIDIEAYIEKTLITKVEPTIKPKKKVKVAKVEEPKEEFKPRITFTDNIKPIIDIESEYTFKDAEYVLKGKVGDKGGSEKLYLFLKKGEGKRKLITDNQGEFEIPGFSLENEEITLIAIDGSKNKTTKIVKVIIDIEEETEVAKVYEQLKPVKKGIKNNNRIAIIIGVESYENSNKALFASNDAKLFKYFANKALGISPTNIKLLIDNDAKRLDTIETLKAWLPRKIEANKSELFVFFSGHGYPSKDGDLYLIPQNGDPRFLEDSALSQKYIIDHIEKLKPKSVTMFFDACYSGQSKTGEFLVAGLKPLKIITANEDIPSNFSIFSSSEYTQVSSTIKEAKHGIFSYYLMKGLEGKADNNKDKQITNGELIAYLKTNVSKEAFTQNREQDPMLSGDENKVLMRYR